VLTKLGRVVYIGREDQSIHETMTELDASAILDAVPRVRHASGGCGPVVAPRPVAGVSRAPRIDKGIDGAYVAAVHFTFESVERNGARRLRG